METIYYTIHRPVKQRERDNIVDLAAYRRQAEAAARRADGTCGPAGAHREEMWEEPASAAEEERSPRRPLRVWALDLCASLGVVVMTIACTLRVLLG